MLTFSRFQQAGNFLLARHEDRLVYVQIMEKGNGFMIYSAKGLELQETSCHSLEATRYYTYLCMYMHTYQQP
jgi:hypothetical protein